MEMEGYKQEFIEFMVDSQVLKFGDFTLKSGRKSPFFMNAGAYVTGAQLRKLGDVRDIKELKPGRSVYRELIMVKVRADAKQRPEVLSIADIFRAKIVDVEPESMIIELTGDQSKLEAFLNLLDGYEILELARTGITGLSRGIKDVTYLE